MNAPSALSESPAHAPARQARNLLERVLFTLREVPLSFDREGVSERLLRALANLYTVLDTDLRHRAHYDAINEALQAIDEAGQMLAGAGDRQQVYALDSALNTLWQARTCVEFGSSRAFPELIGRRLDLVEVAGVVERAPPFKASRGVPELHHILRPPLPIAVDVAASFELPAPESAVQVRPTAPTSFDELRQLAERASAGDFEQKEDAEHAAQRAELQPLLAYEPAIEERELLRQLARDTLEDIASLSSLRKPIAGETWIDQAPFEQRLLDNLDYFASLGAPAFTGVALYHAEADAPDAARAFAAAFALGSVQGSDCVHAALTIAKQSPPEEMPGFADGFALAANSLADRELAVLLEHPKAEIALMALNALGRRGSLSDDACEQVLARADAPMTLELTRALAFNGSAERAPRLLEQLLNQSPDDDTFLAAAESLLVRGQTQTRDALRSVLDWSSSQSARRVAGALSLLCLSGNASDVERILAAAALVPTAATARALGRYGHLRVIPFLQALLSAEDESVSAAAAQALERVTGAGLFETVEVPWVTDLPPGLPDTPGIPNPTRPVQRVIREPTAWLAFLERETPKFQPEKRYRAGRPFRPQFVLDELTAAHTPAEERQLAALEFRIVSGVQTRFSPDDWVIRQQAHLREMADGIASRNAPEGAWWMHGFPATAATAQPLPGNQPAPQPLSKRPASNLEALLAAAESMGDEPGGLMLREFAMLSAELEVNPAGWAMAFSKYGIADRAHWDATARAWRERLSAEKSLETEWRRLHTNAVEHWRLVFARRQ